MSSPAAIVVKQLSKGFHVHSGSELLRRKLTRAVRGARLDKHIVLEDINFEIARGESVAIVGRNGAGKSTLLSCVAGLLRPDSGSVEVSGRVGPLLQLGAGFHQDLTGLENITLNASLMGLARREERALRDRILDFAEIGDYIFEPLRTYSSGMILRLAFSIAIHMNPEVLIVDEVLGVGDQHFQEKCFARFLDFRAQGHTILAVSHSMETLRQLCSRGLWLEQGRLAMDGPVEAVLAAYASS